MKTFLNDHLEAVITFFSTLFLVTLPSLFKWNKTKDNYSKIYIIDFLKSQVKNLTDSNNILVKEVNLLKELNSRLSSEISEIKNQLNIFYAAHIDSPLPMWIKDNNGTMLSVNKAYEKHFLRHLGYTVQDYIGHKDEKIWGKKTADLFKEHDRIAIEKNQWKGDELNSEHSEILGKWNFLKYVRKIGDYVVGVEGVAFPKENYNIKLI